MPGQYTLADLEPAPASGAGRFTAEDITPMPAHAGRTGVDTAVDLLPTALATAFSLAGGGKATLPGMVLAGVGGAGGEGYRQAISALRGDWDKVPPDLQSQARAIVTEFAKQGGTEGVGRAMGPLVKLFGRALYRTALKPSKAIRQEFPTVVKDAVEAGIPITRMGTGAAKAEAMVDASGKAVADKLAVAEAAGAKPVRMRPVAKSLQRTEAKVSEQAIRQDDLTTLRGIRDQLLAENPGPVSLTRAQTMKQAEQRKAVEGYRKIARGADVNSVPLDARMDVARGLRQSIERRAPDVGDMNARTQRLIGVEQAVKNAEDRIANNNLVGMGDLISIGMGAGAGAAHSPGSGAITAALTAALTRPELASRLGIVMDRAGNPLVTPQVARALVALFQEMNTRANTSPEAP